MSELLRIRGYLPPKDTAVMGIDPGFASVGLAVVHSEPDVETGRVVVDAAVIETTKTSTALAAARKKAKLPPISKFEDNARRWMEIEKRLRDTIVDYNIKVIAMEALSYPRHAAVAAQIAMFVGGLISLAGSMDVTVVAITPRGLKEIIAGSDIIDKRDVENKLRRIYPEFAEILTDSGLKKSQHNHAFDALAAAEAYIRHAEGEHGTDH